MIAVLNANVSRWRWIALTLGVTVTTVILGCGDDSGLARRYRVTGMVRYKGQPVTKGTIAFEPANPPLPEGRHASGFIENGSYTLTTATEGDGALPGEYNVVISSSSLDTRELAKGGLLHQGDAAHQKALKADKSPIPIKYARADSSGLKAKVEARPTTINFDLTD
ncbi:MAG TPA: hypothetical protein VFF52_04440 [Isosphaeraceae bacterium]|nr:hypothetical protein [Isosphaeraceae bacterium]